MKIHFNIDLTTDERRTLEVYANGGKLLTRGEATEILTAMVRMALVLAHNSEPRRRFVGDPSDFRPARRKPPASPSIKKGKRK